MSGSVVCSHACYVVSVNAFHVAGECRRQVNKLTNLVKNVNILEFHDHIWNNHEKYIEISTNMPVIGSQIREIAVKILKKCEKVNTILLSKRNPRIARAVTLWMRLLVSYNS